MSYRNAGFTWAESEISKLASQLVNIGVQLATPLGVRLGIAAANATYWQRGAAVVVYTNAPNRDSHLFGGSDQLARQLSA